ncbi:hypothetical protein DFH09DRAFT_1326060 [Mycena vulgaris]|nr:hypothetical protein DFH09DRAFT_1326060 [Mycena vulgaris]
MRASPLCVILSVQEPITDYTASYPVDFAHLFTGPLEDDDDDLEDTNSIALDTSPWTAVCEGSPFPATHPALKEVLFVVQPVGNLQTTTHDGPFTVLVLGGPLRPRGYVKNTSVGSVKTPTKPKVLGKDNSRSTRTPRLARRPAFRVG